MGTADEDRLSKFSVCSPGSLGVDVFSPIYVYFTGFSDSLRHASEVFPRGYSLRCITVNINRTTKIFTPHPVLKEMEVILITFIFVWYSLTQLSFWCFIGCRWRGLHACTLVMWQICATTRQTRITARQRISCPMSFKVIGDEVHVT